jgi:hypothetical protein
MSTTQQEDDLTRRAMQTAGEEQPSADFTVNFMARLREHVNSPQFIYRPVFSKQTWYIIAAFAVIAFISFLLIPSAPLDAAVATPLAKLEPLANNISSIWASLRELFSGQGIWMIGIALVPVLYFTDRFLRKQFKKSSVTSN